VAHIHRIEVALKDENLDSNGFSVKKDIEDDLQINGIDSIKATELYYFYTQIEEEKLKEIAEKVFIDPIIQKYSLDETIFQNYNYFIEVKFNEDVTDNVGIIAKEAMEDYLGEKISGKIRTAKRYYFEGNISKEDLEKIGKELLANEVIETFEVKHKLFEKKFDQKSASQINGGKNE